MKVIYFFIVISVYAPSLWAVEEEVHSYDQLLQEVFRTALVYPQDRGEMQLSLLPSYFNNSEAKTTSIPLDIEYGITDRWQVDLLIPYVFIKPSEEPKINGFSDIEVSTQYSFMNIANTNYHVALLLDVELSTGNLNKGLSEGYYEYEPSIAFAKDLPKLSHSQLFGQMGFNIVQRSKNKKIHPTIVSGNEKLDDGSIADKIDVEAVGADGDNSFFLNLGFFYPVDAARYVIETNWETNLGKHNGTENQLYITPGVVWELPSHWEIALGGSAGLTHSSDEYDLFFRVTYDFDILENKSQSKTLIR